LVLKQLVSILVLSQFKNTDLLIDSYISCISFIWY